MPSAYELMSAEEDAAPREQSKDGINGRPSGQLAKTNEQRIIYLDTQMRKRASSQLFVGAVAGICGIAFVTALGLHRIFTTEDYNLNGEHFASGERYFPACISEMVYDPDTPSGKAFIAFMMIAAICMLISWYPYQLSNVFIPDAKRPTAMCFEQPKYMPTWNDLRVFVPPIGLMLVALIQSTPEGLMGYRENIAEQIHANGAMAMIGSHCIFEFYALCQLKLSTSEKVVRWILSILALGFGVGFAITCQLYSRATDLGICCKDVWVVPSVSNVTAATDNHHFYIADLDEHRMEYGKKMLLDTAKGWALILKYSEFTCEVLSVLFFAMGLLAIWFYAPERNLDAPLGELPAMISMEEPLKKAADKDEETN